MSAKPVQLYDYTYSGHSHRIRNFLSIIGKDYEKIPVDMRAGEHKAPDYMKLSPMGQVPTLVHGDLVITDSTAALVYLALSFADESWSPRDPAGAATVQRWLSAASAEVYRGPVQARAGKLFRRDVDMDRAAAEATRLFDWMQGELDGRTWLAADHPTIADIAVYSYLRVADEGGLDIAPYPAIGRWLADVESIDGFEEMPRSNS